MVRQKIDRTGEEGVNNFGSKMIIVRYRRNDDVDIYFPEYNWTAKNTTYDNFKRGEIKCPYEPRVYGKGYIGEGKYKAGKNGKMTKYYNTWHSMLRRCYDSNNKRIYLGVYKTIEEAFDVYKEFRESVIKQVSDEYYSKGLIPKKVYDALYNYEVLITD